MSEEKLFSVEEANGMLPFLQETLERIRIARQVVLAGAEHIRRRAPENGGGKQGQEYWNALRELRTDVEALSERGILLRDPETGLVDFPTTLDGEPAFLCWRMGEETVAFWHGPDTGFAGRRPLEGEIG